MTMLFITAQSAPVKEYDENGEIKQEICDFCEITVPINEKLGFRPMWAVPITTFKETLASMLLVAPNYPNYLCIFDTEEYVRIDKVKHYKEVMDDMQELSYPIADASLPDYRCEFALNIEKLGAPLCVGNIAEILTFVGTGEHCSELFSIWTKNAVPESFAKTLRTYVKEMYLPENASSIRKQMEEVGLANIDSRVTLNTAWILYRMTVLPIILWGFCTDTKTDMGSGQAGMELSVVESCAKTHVILQELCNQMAYWSMQDCTAEKFDYIYEQTMRFIMDELPLLEAWFEGKKIGRNDRCPCGSGKKYKKCHGPLVF